VPGTTDVQAPLEAQGRGFVHGHAKGHSIITPGMKWLRSVRHDLAEAVRSLRQSLLSTAATVQYEAANEPARQMGVGIIAPEPFTERQQRQSRMDGAEDRDGTVREYVPVAPPVMQPHTLQEKILAAAENRTPVVGSATYRNLLLTGAFQLRSHGTGKHSVLLS